MSVRPIERVPAPQQANERDTLCGLLDFLRATVVNKVAGLSEELARNAPVAPSAITPLGMIKHLTAVERWWFSIDFAARDVPTPWPDGASFDGFELSDDDTLADAVRDYLAECAASREVALAADLDEPARAPGMEFTLRYALAHLVEETARHCGHLDLMREALDGQRGQ
ncbi:MAG: DUF664 domain-containing protein [Pseudonocardiaceae bacterium]|nr:DUF664 domain-containing protein [Pseudonocardiaceae bacterium]